MNRPADKRLDAAVTRLPNSIQPEHDLWPGIATRIVPRHARPWPRKLWSHAGAVAAVVVVAASISWATFRGGVRPSEDSGIAVTVPVMHPVPDQSPRAAFAAQLASDNSLPPKARRALLENLRLLDDSIRRTQAEIKKYPGDVNLQALLFNLYQQETRLMNEAQQAQIQTTVRNTI